MEDWMARKGTYAWACTCEKRIDCVDCGGEEPRGDARPRTEANQTRGKRIYMGPALGVPSLSEMALYSRAPALSALQR